MAALTAALFARRTCLTIGGALALAIPLYAATLDYVVEREIWLQRATGWCALGALLLALSMTPLRRLAERLDRRLIASRLPALRRSFGITAACFALAHAGLGLSTYLWGSWAVVTAKPFLRAGLLTLVVLTALLLTSFPRIVRALRIRLWKPLHRLAYVAALLAFQHLMLSPFAERRVVIGLYLLVVAINCLRFLGRRVAQADAPQRT